MKNVKLNKQVCRLKERFTVLQDYAYIMLLTEVDKKRCVRNGIYSANDNKCFNCDLKKECKCLFDKSTTSIMEHNLQNVIKEMKVARDYIERKVDHIIKDDSACDCDPCSWLAEYDNSHSEAIEVLRAETNEVTL